MDNRRYIKVLEEIAARLQIRGDNPFRIRAFERAARALDDLDEPVETRLDDGSVTEISGIGASIAEDLAAIRASGTCPLLEELRTLLPPGLTDLLQVQGLGPRKVGTLWKALGIEDLAQLEAEAQAGRVGSLKGFGKKTEANILQEIERLRSHAGRTPAAEAWPQAVRILSWLRDMQEVERAEIAGSLRRGRETVGDLDIVVASLEPAPIMQRFVDDDDVSEVLAHGDTKSSVRLQSGLQADLRVVPPEVFGATLHHFTGSKEHNVQLRQRAQKRGLRVSEWGVFRKGEGDDDSQERIACGSEEEIFAAVGLPWIPPELREDRGEIERAESTEGLPSLVGLDDLVADLHLHTTWSDGRHSIDAMTEAAMALGHAYLCITDHSGSLKVANGLDGERLRAQIDEIDAWNDAHDGHFRLLKGLEVDILEDGSIDMEPEVLERLDWVVGSIHQWMKQDSDTMTQRLVRAVHSGWLSAVGHPTTRIVGRRDGIAFDFDALLDACLEMGVALEVNSSPWRLDLDERNIKRVLERGPLMLTINTDAHHTDELQQLHFGVRTARRAWTPPDRVLNTLPLEAFLERRRKPEAA